MIPAERANAKPRTPGSPVEYYYVDDMHNYDQILRACGHFTHRHGKIDRFESHNEYWLETDARIRTDSEGPVGNLQWSTSSLTARPNHDILLSYLRGQTSDD